MNEEHAVGPEIKPGEQTTEYAAMQNSAWWGKVMMVLGILSTSVGGIVEGIREYQQSVASATGGAVPGESKLVVVLLVCGIALSIIGGIQKALTQTAYISGRSLVKAAAARDLPPPPQV